MKEHISVNNISKLNHWADASDKHGIMAKKIKPVNQLIKEDTLSIDMDVYDIQSHMNFIKEQSSQSEGRSLMSEAHHSISYSHVMQLFG